MAKRSVTICTYSVLTLLIMLGVTISTAAQTQPALSDSIGIVDSIPLPDSLASDTQLPHDSLDISDTLTDAQRQLLEFEERYRRNQEQKQQERKEQFSYLDTLISYFASPRLNQREKVDLSFYGDPGDYFKFDPSYFIIDHQVTPMRKTVQPFGLSGGRLSLLHDGWPIRPFEHIPEPDGMADLNDMPSALDHDIFLLPGPVGRLFGGQHSVATLLTRPKRPDSYEPESAFLVDKGSFAYSYARGRYSKRFIDGREINMSIGYRKADGASPSFFENSYHYFGDVYYPVREDYAFQVTGHLYNRDGRLAIRPDAGGALQARDRFDRSLGVALVRHNDDHSRRYEIGYRHLRQASYLTQRYAANFDKTGHGGYVSREWISGKALFKVLAEADYLEYKSGAISPLAIRRSGGVTASLATIGKTNRYTVQISEHFVKDFNSISSATALFQRETEKLFVLMSVGYSERAPSLYELNLPYKEAPIYGLSISDYADHGNPDLVKEKQLIGSLNIDLGRPDNSISLHITGGRILDGIDWRHVREGNQVVFSPVNGDVDFATFTGKSAIRISDLLRFHGGASYHYLDYAEIDNKAYAPEYQFFSGMELHVYWPQKLIDLNAYGEVVYVGPYDGYDKIGLGMEPIANVRLSFRMGSFRFHYIFRNVLSRVYEAREDFAVLGRYNSWGFRWIFLN